MKQSGGQPTVVLVGNPNVGKSTLFNALTGSKQKVVNAPGTTVDVMEGRIASLNARLLDLPGTYSLIPESLDEEVVTETLAGKPGSLTDIENGQRIDLVLAVLDATALRRSLYLLAQVAQAGLPVAAVVTLADVVEHEGEHVDQDRLSNALGIPVLVADPRKKGAAADITEFIQQSLDSAPRVRGVYPDPNAPGYRELNTRPQPGNELPGGCCNRTALAQDRGRPTGPDQLELLPIEPSGMADPEAEQRAQATQRAAAIFDWVEALSAGLENDTPAEVKPSRSDKIDRFLLHPLVGIPFFFALMYLLFKIAGEWVGPVQDWFDALFSDDSEGAWSLANLTSHGLAAIGADGGWLEHLLVGGVCTGLGVVASFVPLMAVIFLAISILEDSGYMARAAFLGDRVMRSLGLDGRVILPFIMGFGCNLPALAGIKSLPSARQRIVSTLLIPYTSCAARLTIYLMVARIFFPDNVGTVVFGLYAVSILMVVLGALILKPFFGGSGQAPLMLILPAYQMPRYLVLLRTTVMHVWQFVKGAGATIVAMTLVVWLMAAIPMAGDYKFADEIPMSDSLYGRTAQVLEPVFEPAGFGEWHMTGALMTGFVAKETVVSSIVTSYALDPEVDGGDAEDNGEDLGKLPELVNASFQKSAPEAPRLAAIAFLIFVLTYTPCLATVAEQARQIGWKMTTVAVIAQLVIAWLLAVGVFQIGKLFV
ncbi:ferrous iron transport protein B [Boudabousia liubingyangii]|uniref:ferrous iron transport protein B n=1 Tax=Boudabousia liubingyangii TaxID=1921764 RepID=UPI002F267B41